MDGAGFRDRGRIAGYSEIQFDAEPPEPSDIAVGLEIQLLACAGWRRGRGSLPEHLFNSILRPRQLSGTLPPASRRGSQLFEKQMKPVAHSGGGRGAQLAGILHKLGFVHRQNL